MAADPLRLWRAADRFYDIARRRTNLRQIGLLIFAVTPLVLVQTASAAKYIAVGSAGFAVFEVAFVQPWEKEFVRKGAICQEKYDCSLFQLPMNNVLVPPLSDSEIDSAARKGAVPTGDWYDYQADDPDGVSRCQAQNGHWSVEVQRSQRRLVRSIEVFIVALGFAVGWSRGMTIDAYLLQIAVPSTPGLVAVEGLLARHREATTDWATICQRASVANPTSESLRETQDLIFLARSRYPLVPKAVYRHVRRRLQE